MLFLSVEYYDVVQELPLTSDIFTCHVKWFTTLLCFYLQLSNLQCSAWPEQIDLSKL